MSKSTLTPPAISASNDQQEDNNFQRWVQWKNAIAEANKPERKKYQLFPDDGYPDGFPF